MQTAFAERSWFGHPRGLSTLFFTEMWERFSYYGMRALLVLFMVAPISTGGLGFGTARAASIYGLYTMLVYGACIPGGLVADRLLGHYRSILVGGIVIALGHFTMAIPRTETFFLGLGLVVIGTGLLKPNVSSMVGMLYSPDDARRDSGFSIYYMGINIGATAAPLVCGWLGQRVNWHAGFAAAGVGMLAGVAQYIAGRKRLPASAPRPARATRVVTRQPMTRSEWGRVGAIMVFFFFAIVFFGAFDQAGSSLTLFADRHTRLSILGFGFPSSWFQAEQPLFVIMLTPFFAWLWVALARRHREPSATSKFSTGLLLVGAGFLLLVPAAWMAESRGVRVSPMWLTGLYLIHTFGELCLSPVGLSLVTKLAPPRLVGFMMGIWFLGASFGDYLAGAAAALLEVISFHVLFASVCAIAVLSSVAILFLRPLVHRLAGDSKDGATAARLAA
jgi:POT family proton-dependent oligopeptide transporter